MIHGTRNDLSNALGLSERRISQLAADRIIPRPTSSGRYDLIRCVRSYIDHLRKEKGTLTEERTLLVRAKRQRAELDLKQKQGELVNKWEYDQKAFAFARRTRDRLQNVPDRVSGLCAAEQDQFKVHAMLVKEIHEALCELSEGWGKRS
jgi:hypothetical protein